LRLLRFPIVLFAALVVASCGGDDPVSPKDPTEVDFAASLGIDLDQMTKTASGLYYQDLLVGDGEEAEATDEVTVHYTGWLDTGQVFDSSVDGDPISLPLSGVIPGWREGVTGMKVGGKRKLVIPPDLAYGQKGVPGVIPQYATLIFDVELLGIVE
jgi:FKBP-type peptidyl-prolyl cis-trans isomerase FkpA